jgi:transcription antitermination factor NusG
MTATAETIPRKVFDERAVPVLRNSDAAAGGFTQPCRCNGEPGPRWYCASVRFGSAEMARDALDFLDFGTFLPLVACEIRHARRVRVVERPLFPGYVFLRFDVRAEAWRRAYQTRRIRIFGSAPDRPVPLPAGLVERWIAEGWDRPLPRDVAADLIAAGAHVAITDGPFADHHGLCLWDDGQRVRVLLSLLGRQLEASLPRGQVVPA